MFDAYQWIAVGPGREYIPVARAKKGQKGGKTVENTAKVDATLRVFDRAPLVPTHANDNDGWMDDHQWVVE
jgi:hypothetical protein